MWGFSPVNKRRQRLANDGSRTKGPRLPTIIAFSNQNRLLIDALLGHTVGLLIYNLLENIDFAVLDGLLIGVIYGFGPFHH